VSSRIPLSYTCVNSSTDSRNMLPSWKQRRSGLCLPSDPVADCRYHMILGYPQSPRNTAFIRTFPIYHSFEYVVAITISSIRMEDPQFHGMILPITVGETRLRGTTHALTAPDAEDRGIDPDHHSKVKEFSSPSCSLAHFFYLPPPSVSCFVPVTLPLFSSLYVCKDGCST
jgi:hypothetical protein